jgi:hypothetical protein
MTFKLFSGRQRGTGFRFQTLSLTPCFSHWHPHKSQRARFSGLFLPLLLFAAGCNTLPPMPPVNLQEPGWTVREGQAIWRTSRTAPEIAGELLLATREDGRALVQFTKTPFPLVMAQVTTNSWQIQLPTQNKRYSGHGQPPLRLIWLYLPRLMLGAPPPQGWSWRRLETNRWLLEINRTGETLECYFMK